MKKTQPFLVVIALILLVISCKKVEEVKPEKVVSLKNEFKENFYLQKGFYGGKQYFKPETIDKFNTCYFCENDNRRGVGFDKPQLSDEGPTCGCVSMTSFGHSGFTGTYAWADPEADIVYVFLANRTYPNAGKNLLLKENIRTEIQRLIYEAIEE